MNKFRIAVIGAGGIAMNVHLPGLDGHPAAEVVALCDTNPEALRRAGEKWPGKPAFADAAGMLAAVACDAVAICTSNDAHHPLALLAIDAGKHVLCEKPLAMNGAQAREMAERAESAGIRHMVAFSYRFVPAARWAREIVRQGLLGRITHVNAHYLQGWGLREDAPLVWRFDRPLTGTGVLGDLGVHLIDLVRFILGVEFTAVCGQFRTFTPRRRRPATGEMAAVEVDDGASFLADLSNGAAGSFVATRHAYGRGNYQRVEIYGTSGALIYHVERPRELELCLGEPFRESGAFAAVPVPDRLARGFSQSETFIELLKDNTALEAVPTFADGLAAQLVVDAVVEAVESGKWVEVR